MKKNKARGKDRIHTQRVIRGENCNKPVFEHTDLNKVQSNSQEKAKEESCGVKSELKGVEETGFTSMN